MQFFGRRQRLDLFGIQQEIARIRLCDLGRCVIAKRQGLCLERVHPVPCGNEIRHLRGCDMFEPRRGHFLARFAHRLGDGAGARHVGQGDPARQRGMAAVTIRQRLSGGEGGGFGAPCRTAQHLALFAGLGQRLILGDQAADGGQHVADLIRKGSGTGVAHVIHGTPPRGWRQFCRPIARRTRSRFSPCLLVKGASRTAL